MKKSRKELQELQKLLNGYRNVALTQEKEINALIAQNDELKDNLKEASDGLSRIHRWISDYIGDDRSVESDYITLPTQCDEPGCYTCRYDC